MYNLGKNRTLPTMHPKVILLLASLLACLSIQDLQAQTRFITDDFEVMLRTGPSIQNKIVKPLRSGTKLEIVREDAGNGHSLVQTDQGEQGYVLTRFLSPNRAARSRVRYLEGQLKTLRSKPGELQSLLADSQDENQELIKLNTELSASLKKVADELEELKRVSSDAVGLSSRNTKLESEVHQLLLQLDDIRIQNESLKDQTAQRWFIYGGGVMALGLVFGWILSIYRRPRRSSWGS